MQHKVKRKTFFGEPAVLLEKPFPRNVEVTSEFAEILKIKRENFLQYLINNPDWCLEFTKSIAEKSIKKLTHSKILFF